MKTLSEVYGKETSFTNHLSFDLVELSKITQMVGLPEITRAKAEFSIPGGSIDIVGFTSKDEVVVFEHQNITNFGRADQAHVFKTMGYAEMLHIQDYKVIGSILLCESVEEHYVKLFQSARDLYLKNKKLGYKNLHIVKSQWDDNDNYVPILFDLTNISKRQEAWKIKEFKEFVENYAINWEIVGEETRPTTKTLWFRDVSRARHYVHQTKSLIKVGLHYDNPTDAEREIVKLHNGRVGVNRCTIEYELPLDSTMHQWWYQAELLKQSVRREINNSLQPANKCCIIYT